ncbi:protein BIG GRAIN 1-like A [Impatiens glandulifera]|uniref:protein BIG GRAIN 1-like A n=1 Tax=Impatiens glandulifera TaxID=253017 RepID=UPI001FB151CE|nr:protein BIG GRAIN 1-like A [Impatiens glandulifera]
MDTRGISYQPKRRTPSFSSSLLDSIYRSIDNPNCKDDEFSALETDESVQCRQRRKQRDNTFLHDDERIRRAIMIEKWMENKNRTNINKTYKLRSCYSASSSSDSSSGGVFSSSSETESKSPLPFTPIFTRSSDLHQQTPKREGRLTRTKSRALKLYGDLKKAKQPISPGRRITDFLNSLFNSKKLEDLNSERRTQPVKNSTTTCSLSSSFGRPSCLSKPPSPSFRGRNRNIDRSPKRSVRFYPVTVIVDEENRSCGHKYIYENETDPGLMRNSFMRKGSGNREKTDDAYRGRRTYNIDENRQEVEDEDEDDSESCTSSDLFELENIGVGRTCREELPVYASTNLKTTNKAIVACAI